MQMRIEKLPGGWRITIPEAPHNSEFVYEVPVMRTGPEHIGRMQERLARKVALRAFFMECFFKTLPSDWSAYWETHTESPFEKWERDNRLDWNDHFHYAIRSFCDEAWRIQMQWYDWHWKEYGWNAY